MLSKNTMYLINNSHVVLTLDLIQGTLTGQQQDYTSVRKMYISCYLLWQLICSSPTEIGGKLINRRRFLVVVGHALATFIPEMYGSGKPPP